MFQRKKKPIREKVLAMLEERILNAENEHLRMQEEIQAKFDEENIERLKNFSIQQKHLTEKFVKDICGKIIN